MTPQELAARLDHTLLRPDAGAAAIESLCAEAVEFGFAAVCVNPRWLPAVVRLLDGESPAPCAVLGFPLGANGSDLKGREAEWLCDRGASELDMVLDIGALKDGADAEVRSEIQQIANLCGDDVTLKVILETSLLSDDEKRRACRLAVEAGADFVKTSTGFGSAGATEHDVRLLRESVGDALGVKASGGIRNLSQVEAMLAAGATRLGTSSGPAILREIQAT